MLENLQKATSERLVDFASADVVCCIFARPHTAQRYVCHNMSQTFAVAEAMLQEDSIDSVVVPGFNEEVVPERNDPVMLWHTKLPVRFPVISEAAKAFLVLFSSKWSCEYGLSVMDEIQNALQGRLTNTW